MVAGTNLSHILLCAGSIDDWCETSADAWQQRIRLVARAASQGGASWATIVPNEKFSDASPPETDARVGTIRHTLEHVCHGTRYADRVVLISDGGVSVIVDLVADGRQRIVNAALRSTGTAVTERTLASLISAPAPSDPDLVVILGSATVVPRALTWELAYAEIVFLDIPWFHLQSEHLEMAIDDFTRRDRRFGGVDS